MAIIKTESYRILPDGTETTREVKVEDKSVNREVKVKRPRKDKKESKKDRK